MKDIIKEVLTETAERFKAPIYGRTLSIDPFKEKVQTVVGPRRAGKSSLLKLAVHQLLTDNISWENICYLPTEDERLRGEPFEPDLILQAFRELYPDNAALNEMHFFFDEIQYLNKWEPFVNRIQEQLSKRVIITGSNSKLLHTEVASVLRGRSLSMELLPLSFAEYLNFKNIDVKLVGEGKALLINAFKEYMLWGGFPETVLADPEDRRPILQEYFNTLLYRDILDMQQPANYSYLRYLFHRIADNTGKAVALRKIFMELKSRGYAVSLNSIYEMADLAESVYFFKRITRFDHSLIKRENAEKKSYFVDNGMLNAISGNFSSNAGTLLENHIFWQLYRMYGNIYTSDIYYYADNYHECDFILYKEGGIALPVQVCLQMNDESTRQRELKSLVKACRQTGSSRGVIITREEESEFIFQEIKIHVLAAWKWCAKPVDLHLL